MLFRYVFITTVLLLPVPVYAAEGTQPPPDELNFDQPFDQAKLKSALRSILNQAIDLIDDHIEFNANLQGDAEHNQQHGQLKMKIYPRGKSQSDAHLSGELHFRSSPDAQHFSFDLKLPKEPVSSSSSSDGTI